MKNPRKYIVFIMAAVTSFSVASILFAYNAYEADQNSYEQYNQSFEIDCSALPFDNSHWLVNEGSIRGNNWNSLGGGWNSDVDWGQQTINDLPEDESFVTQAQADLISEFGEERMYNIGRSRAIDAQIIASLPTNRLGETIYPSYIGGIYFNEDGNIVVQRVAREATRLRSAEAFFENLISMDVIIEEVEFSHNELLDVINFLESIWATDPAYIDIFPAFALDTLNNRVAVHLADYSENGIESFRATIKDSPAIRFEESQGFTFWHTLPTKEEIRNSMKGQMNLQTYLP